MASRLAIAACAVGLAGAACSGNDPGTGGRQPAVVSRDAGPSHALDPASNRGYVAVITARGNVDLAPKVPGEVVKMHVATGDRVVEDALIATLDNRPAREALAMAKAALESARATRSRADVEVADKQRELDLTKKLVAEGTRAARTEQDAEFALQKAKAARRQSAAAVSEQRAQVQRLERELGETQLRAPFAGTIATAYVTAGSLVGPNTPVARLISGDELTVKFAVPPEGAGDVAMGDRVAVELEGIDQPLSAIVIEMTPELDPASRMFFVEAELVIPSDLTARVRSGLAAWVKRAPARD